MFNTITLFTILLLSSLTQAADSRIFLVTDYNQTYTGTAFEINTNKGKVTITNAHVCNGNSELIAILPNPLRFKILLVRRVYNKHDLCMLSPVATLPAFDIAEDYLPGDLVFVEGFPKGVHGYSKGKVGQYEISLHGFIYAIYYGPIFPGNSGSPVQNRYGRVIGVIAIGNSDYSVGGFVPLEYLKDFLDNTEFML